MAKGSLIVVALGGNAITQDDQEGNVGEQFANSRHAAGPLADLVEQGHQIVVTHGNGPQIGNFLLRNWAAAEVIYPLPMEVAVAHVQGGMGFMVAQTLMNELGLRGLNREVTCVVTTILVDGADPAFDNPTKPIGRTFEKPEADRLAREQSWSVREVSPGKFRRVVPSPVPLKIMEIEHIRRAVAAGELLVACGGGGVPVIQDGDQGLRGVRAVIDKDLASSLLARDLGADAMLILTNVERVAIDFGTPQQRSVETMTLEEARTWFAAGQFPPGSMGPKIDGAIRFLEDGKPDARVIIGPLSHAADAVAGRTGTCIFKG